MPTHEWHSGESHSSPIKRSLEIVIPFPWFQVPVVTVVWHCALEMLLESTPPHYYGCWARKTQNPQPSSCCAIRSMGDSHSTVPVPSPTSLQASHLPDLILQGKASLIGYWQRWALSYDFFSYSILLFSSVQSSVLVYHYNFSILLSFLTIPQL